MFHNLTFWTTVHDFQRHLRLRACLASPTSDDLLHDEPFVVDVVLHDLRPFEIIAEARLSQPAYTALTKLQQRPSSSLFLVGKGDLKYGPEEVVAEIMQHTAPLALQAGVVAPVVRFRLRSVKARKCWGEPGSSSSVRRITFFPSVDPPAATAALKFHPTAAFALPGDAHVQSAGAIEWAIVANTHRSTTSTFGLPSTAERPALAMVAAGAAEVVEPATTRFATFLSFVMRDLVQPTLTKFDGHTDAASLSDVENSPTESCVEFLRVPRSSRESGMLWSSWTDGLDPLGPSLVDDTLDPVFRAMSLVASSWSTRTPEERFTLLFLALEACKSWYADEAGVEFWLPEKPQRKRVTRAVKAAVSQVIEELRDESEADDPREMPQGKEKEILRTPVRELIKELAEKRAKVPIDDLPLGKLLQRRNKIFHGSLDALDLPPDEFEEHVAHLSCLMERLLLGVLGLPYDASAARYPYEPTNYRGAGSSTSVAAVAGWDFANRTSENPDS